MLIKAFDIPANPPWELGRAGHRKKVSSCSPSTNTPLHARSHDWKAITIPPPTQMRTLGWRKATHYLTLKARVSGTNVEMTRRGTYEKAMWQQRKASLRKAFFLVSATLGLQRIMILYLKPLCFWISSNKCNFSTQTSWVPLAAGMWWIHHSSCTQEAHSLL